MISYIIYRCQYEIVLENSKDDVVLVSMHNVDPDSDGCVHRWLFLARRIAHSLNYFTCAMFVHYTVICYLSQFWSWICRVTSFLLWL